MSPPSPAPYLADRLDLDRPADAPFICRTFHGPARSDILPGNCWPLRPPEEVGLPDRPVYFMPLRSTRGLSWMIPPLRASVRRSFENHLLIRDDVSPVAVTSSSITGQGQWLFSKAALIARTADWGVRTIGCANRGGADVAPSARHPVVR